MLDFTHNQHGNDWLESVSQQDVYIANKYISNEPTDFSSTRIPLLSHDLGGTRVTADDNASKTAALSSSFFLPPPISSSVPPDVVYTRPLCGIKYFSKNHSHQVFKTLSLYKAPEPDSIPNMVYIKCL